MTKEYEMEIALSVEDYKTDEDDIESAQDDLQNDEDKVIQVLKDMGEEFGIEIELGDVNIEFLEFDSNRWHGSGYFNVKFKSSSEPKKIYTMIFFGDEEEAEKYMKEEGIA